MKRLPLVVALLTLSTGTAAATLADPALDAAAEAPALATAALSPLRVAAQRADAPPPSLHGGASDVALPKRSLFDALPALGPLDARAPLALPAGGASRFLLLPDGAFVADLAGALQLDAGPLATGWIPFAPFAPAPAPAAPVLFESRSDASARAGAPAPSPALPLASPRDRPTAEPRAQDATTIAPPGGDAPVALALAGGLAAAGALGLLGFALYHRIRPASTLENDTRKVIFAAVCDRPGLGVHDIADAAGVSYSTATYHLERLLGAGMIVMTPDGNKLCYYKNGGAFTESERKIIPILKNAEATRLLEAILRQPGTYRAALAQELGVTATTINWHLRRLRDAGLVDETREGRSAFLRARVDHLAASLSSLAQKLGPSEEPAAKRLLAQAQGLGAIPSQGAPASGN